MTWPETHFLATIGFLFSFRPRLDLGDKDLGSHDDLFLLLFLGGGGFVFDFDAFHCLGPGFLHDGGLLQSFELQAREGLEERGDGCSCMIHVVYI